MKPSNILFFCHNGVWQVKITDFGISKFLPVDRTSVTSTSKKGTIGFMAPEVLRWGEYRKVSEFSRAWDAKLRIFTNYRQIQLVLSSNRNIFFLIWNIHNTVKNQSWCIFIRADCIYYLFLTTKESDLFSLGIVFFYTLSEGAHPYGSDTLKIEADIRDGEKPSYDALQTKCKANLYFLDLNKL